MKLVGKAKSAIITGTTVLAGMTTSAYAVMDTTAVETALSAGTLIVEGLAAAILLGLAALWVIRKLVKTSNRS